MLLRVLVVSLLLAGCTSPAPSTGAPEEEPYGVKDPEEAAVDPQACPRLALEGLDEAFQLGSPVSFVVRVDNCSTAPLVVASDCYHAAPGPVVDLGMPEGPRATLEPSDAAVPADASWECDRAPQNATLAAGESKSYRFAWDGRVAPYCPDRTSAMPSCEGERPPVAGAYEAAVSFAWDGGSRNAIGAVVLVERDTPRVPVILVNGSYEVSRAPEQPQLPARGEGCPDASVTRAPWSATLLREGPPVRALVVRQFPQGGFGSFGPDALVLPENGTLSLMSAFEPGRVLAVLEDSPEGVRLAGETLTTTPREMTSAYETTWEGQTYQARETLAVALAGDAWVYPPAVPQGC